MKILSKNIKECNIFVLLLIAILIIGGSAYTSYAIFTTKVEGETTIQVGVKCANFNVDDISICQKWQEHLKRIEEESKISSHDGKQIKDNQKENNQQSKNGNDGR